MGWGTRIFSAYAAGVCFILYFVVRSMMLTTEMAEENYYEKELTFNSHIEGVSNANNLSQQISITDNPELIEVVIDSATASGLVNGLIHFYNPASEKADKKIVLKESLSGKYFFRKNLFAKGKYIVRVSFDYQQKPYFTEQVVFIK